MINGRDPNHTFRGDWAGALKELRRIWAASVRVTFHSQCIQSLKMHTTVCLAALQGDWTGALRELELSEESFDLCSEELLKSVDNIGLLLLDSVWCGASPQETSLQSVSYVFVSPLQKPPCNLETGVHLCSHSAAARLVMRAACGLSEAVAHHWQLTPLWCLFAAAGACSSCRTAGVWRRRVQSCGARAPAWPPRTAPTSSGCG